MTARISRRQVLRGASVLGLGAAAWPLLAACGKDEDKPPPKIGFLVPTSIQSVNSTGSLKAFQESMTQLGYVDGQDYTLESRFADGKEADLPRLAVELVDLHVDVILTYSTVAIRAAKEATTTIPIVYATSGDPPADGLADTFAHPGGNATGLTIFIENEHSKRIELLKESVPGLSMIAYLWSPVSGSQPKSYRDRSEDAARTLGLQFLSPEVRTIDDIPAALNNALAWGANGLTTDGITFFANRAQQIVDFGTANKLPVIYFSRTFVSVGGLMSYGPNFLENWRRSASYVDKILKGANPGDLPIERPPKNEFLINLSAARAIGLTIPPSVLQRATEVIQ